MTVVALCSARGAPGVTTTALLLAAAVEGSVLVEADLSGGVLAARYGLGREPGLTTLAAAARSGGEVVWREHAQNAGGVPVLAGPDSPSAARSLWDSSGDRIAAALTGVGPLLVADLGRLGSSVPLAGTIDLGIIVLRPSPEALLTASHRLGELRTACRAVRALVVGGGRYRPETVAEALRVEVCAVVPSDGRAAAMLEGAAAVRSFARTRLARSATALADAVTRVLEDVPASRVAL